MLFSLNCICFLWTTQSLNGYLYILFLLLISDAIIFLILLFCCCCCCSLLQRRGSGLSGDAVLVPPRAASHHNHGFLSVRLSGSKLSCSSFTRVFTAADRRIRPRHWKRVTNLLLITTHINTFALINPDEIGCARSSDQAVAVLWASVQVETKESGQETTFACACLMEGGLFSDRLAWRIRRRYPRLCLNR